jgi:hypothetical protein
MDAINTHAIEVAAHTGLPLKTLHPTVNTKRYVPRNSDRHRWNLEGGDSPAILQILQTDVPESYLELSRKATLI